ncbi:unnamed protein product [Eruca vesicaria subsp. sativa]|uniref:BZIP domain-containing protein n=1 Tax=Eruca vesicaria subsp. sativa TaxID=29727 RepID=A0ABC8J5U6_ERUVS|nr:unnamed protein product [Eruca vesicaria subsp. sativa]
MTQVTMEEVWKEINLASFHKHRHLNIDHEPVLRNQNPTNSIIQDFLSKPLNKEPPPSSSSTHHVSLLLPPATVPSLNPQYSIDTHFDESARFGCLGKKRSQDSDESRGDRRHKRMTKNRESAARSRARKQERVSPYPSFPFQIHVNQKKKKKKKNDKSSVDYTVLPCIKSGMCFYFH